LCSLKEKSGEEWECLDMTDNRRILDRGGKRIYGCCDCFVLHPAGKPRGRLITHDRLYEVSGDIP
jgi:Zn-finger protein